MSIDDTVTELRRLLDEMATAVRPSESSRNDHWRSIRTYSSQRLKLLDQIGMASELGVVAERLVEELIGESQALSQAERPSWTEVAKALKKMGPDGTPAPLAITRQGVRQRYSDQPRVRLVRERARQSELIGLRDRKARSLEQVAARAGNKAERKVHVEMATAELQQVESELAATNEAVARIEVELANLQLQADNAVKFWRKPQFDNGVSRSR